MMKENWVYRRGDIYMANLNPFKGSEQGGTRPVLVLQNNTGNWFRVVTIGGKMRVMVDSFEEWYAGQNHYKKKDAADTAAERRE